MSNYHGGGGRRKNYRGQDDYGSHQPQVYETPEQKLRRTIIALGEVDPVEEIPHVAKAIHENVGLGIRTIAESLWISVTEQPFKIPFYSALIRHLYDKQEGADAGDVAPLGQQILEEFWRGFQAFLDSLAWREIRLCVHLFAHLTVAGIVSAQSMADLLKSFNAVLSEFGATHSRARRAAFCAAEGVMIAGPAIQGLVDPELKDSKDKTIVGHIVNAISEYDASLGSAKSGSASKMLVEPLAHLHKENDEIEHAHELLHTAVTVLQALKDSGFVETADTFPQPYLNYTRISEEAQFDLPSILVAPDVDDMTTEGVDTAKVEKEQWPQFYIRIFDNDVTPDPATPVGYAIRSGILDLVDIFEVNRKECARLLLEFPKWQIPGTFRPHPDAPPRDPLLGKDWQLESTVFEAVIGSNFLLPESEHKSVYYTALLAELCKLSPKLTGPTIGKMVRKLYSLLADGMDVEVAYRFVDWFGVHLSNFNFNWVWREWIPDLHLSPQHPKRVFMRRLVDFEIRLAYFDRILKTLPEPMQSREARVMPEEAPGPEYEYDEPTNPYHDAAQTLLNLLRGRAKADDVIEQLATLKNTISESADGGVNVDSAIRSIAVQSLLHIGSRSFSHFLNAIERYLPLLRNLASGGISSNAGSASTEARMDILSAVAAFWKRNKHMVVIVFDKLMQYQIIDPTDVVSWTFTHGGSPSSEDDARHAFDAFQWDILKGALDKANGRVVVARKRVAQLRKEADDHAAATMATMDVDATGQPDTIPAVESPQLTTALRAFETLTREQRAAITRAVEGFLGYLVSPDQPNPHASQIISETAWFNRANWTEAEWEAWETWGWYRHFSRAFSPYLKNYVQTVESVTLSKIPPDSNPASKLFRKTWNIATGQEVWLLPLLDLDEFLWFYPTDAPHTEITNRARARTPPRPTGALALAMVW